MKMKREHAVWVFLLAVCLSHQTGTLGEEIFFEEEEGTALRRYDDRSLTPNCIGLDLCPHLMSLLTQPTSPNLQRLRDASCGFTVAGRPLVICNKYQDSGGFKPTTAPPSTPHRPKPKLSETSKLNGAECGLAFPERISGGEGAGRGEFPWTVAISAYSSGGTQVVCGGALVSDDFVVTAAHCVADPSHRPRNISHVRVGAHNISRSNENGAEDIGVEAILVHEGFRERPLVRDDLALVKLNKKATFGSNVGPICVPPEDEDEKYYAPYSTSTIVGWGSDGKKKTSYDILQKGNIPLIPGDICKRRFRRIRVSILPQLQVCAGEKGKDSCKGDSGGPLSMEKDNRHFLIGVISFGTIQCDGRLPGVYTKVSSYASWIRETISKNS